MRSSASTSRIPERNRAEHSNDFAKPLGGEFAFAVDGPLLPTPSWKMVFEVYDPAHLQQTLERVVEKMNELAARDGKKGFQWIAPTREVELSYSGNQSTSA